MTRMQDFVQGVYYGMQKDTQTPTACVNSLTEFSAPIESMRNDITALIDTADLDMIFKALYNYNELVNDFVSSLQLCKINTLSQTFSEMPTKQGIGKMLVMLGTGFDQVIESFGLMLSDMSAGKSMDSGIEFGKIVSVLLDFNI